MQFLEGAPEAVRLTGGGESDSGPCSLRRLGGKSEFEAGLSAMWAACRMFRGAAGGNDSDITLHARMPGRYASGTFCSALG